MSILKKSVFAGLAAISLATGFAAEARSLSVINNDDPQYGQACFDRCMNTGKHGHNFCEQRCKVSMPQQSLVKTLGAVRVFRFRSNSNLK